MIYMLRFCVALVLSCPLGALAENWPCWRGPRMDGTSEEKRIPSEWSSSRNVRWKTPLPGHGYASPIVWENRIFTIAADPQTQERKIISLDKKDGRIVWERMVVQAPLERKHDLNSYASSTPATDGVNVYISFLEKNQMVVAAFDLNGNQQWLVRPGEFYSVHGFCSSPVLFKDKVVLNGDHDGNSYLVALNRTDGRTVWKTMRQNKTRSYCVPIIRELSGRTQMILSGDKSVASYDPSNGKLHWILDGPTEQFVASIVYNPGADLLFVTGGYPELHILGLRHDGEGKLDSSKIAWRSTRGVSYVPSPISIGDHVFIVSDGGIASCFEAKSGRILWQERLEGGHHASLVSAENRIYFLSDKGEMTVIEASPHFKIISRNTLGEKCFASPAISNGDMLIRGEKHLYAISQASGSTDK
jgi:outer membrane protein assembly factor BamB